MATRTRQRTTRNRRPEQRATVANGKSSDSGRAHWKKVFRGLFAEAQFSLAIGALITLHHRTRILVLFRIHSPDGIITFMYCFNSFYFLCSGKRRTATKKRRVLIWTCRMSGGTQAVMIRTHKTSNHHSNVN